MGFANAILGGASKLIRRAIESPGFITGVTGWAIRKDGSAEFNNVAARGTLIVTDPPAELRIEPSGAGFVPVFMNGDTVNAEPGVIQTVFTGGAGGQSQTTAGSGRAKTGGNYEASSSWYSSQSAANSRIDHIANLHTWVGPTDVRIPPLDRLAVGSVANNAAETVIGTFDPAINGTWAPLVQGDGWDFEFAGSADAGATSPTLQIRVKLDSTSGLQLAQFSAVTYLAAGGTNRGWWVHGKIYVRTAGSSGELISDISLHHALAATGLAQTERVVSVGGLTVDLTVARKLVVTADWSAAATANIARTLAGAIRRISI